MRNHFEYASFRFPPFPPHIGPWACGFGPFGGGRPGWPNFNGLSCRPHGHHGPLHGSHHGPHHDRHRSPHAESPPRHFSHSPPPTSTEQGHGGRHEHWKSPGHHKSPRCCRHDPPVDQHEDSQNERCCHGHKMRIRSPCKGPPKRGHHHHHWAGHDHHSCGPELCSRDFYESFGPDRRGPHGGPRFGHRRPGPYERLADCTTLRHCENCRSEQDNPLQSENEETQGSNEPEAGRNEKESCYAQDKDQDPTEDAVLVQQIIV